MGEKGGGGIWDGREGLVMVGIFMDRGEVKGYGKYLGNELFRISPPTISIVAKKKRKKKLQKHCKKERESTHKQPNSPTHIQSPQIPIMLPHAQKHHGNAGRVHHADQTAHHVPHRVTLADDEPVQLALVAKGRVEAARLCHAVAAHERFAHH